MRRPSAIRSLRAAIRAVERDVMYHVGNAAAADPAYRSWYEATVSYRNDLARALAIAEGRRS